MITASHLKELGVEQGTAQEWEGPLISVMSKYQINTPQRAAAFIAQLIHESNGFRSMEENFNYKPSALMATYNNSKITRFPKILAEEYGRTTDHAANQPMIAMIAYANRMGNGPVDSGDGWRFRGRGPMQLTGRNNYKAFGDAIGKDLTRDPDQVSQPVLGALAAGWFWNQGNSTGKSLNVLADAGKIDGISRVINGGDNGLEHRRSLYEQALRVMRK